MDTAPQFLLALGGILLLGLATDIIGKRTLLPRVTLLLVLGVLIGPEGLDLIPHLLTDRFEVIAAMALLMVGFLLGGRLTLKTLRRSARQVLWISLSAAHVTIVVVLVLLVVLGTPWELAVLLGCIASATDPAATVDTVVETESRGKFSNLLLSIVALDDAWGLILFSLGLTLVAAVSGLGAGPAPLLLAVQDIGGAVLLGLLIGLPAAFLTGRIRPGQPMLTEALGLVFLCGGLALWLEVSFLISAMVMGSVIANLARHHEYPFHAIEDIEWPFMVIFFLLAGASLVLDGLLAVAGLLCAYILSRLAGKVLGGWLGARAAGADRRTRRWIGAALLPQAGAAMGMALVAAGEFPEHRQVLLSVVIGSTVLFEILGPPITRLALYRTRRSRPHQA
jgi:Kef-type K+ transport system membrane component KefB